MGEKEDTKELEKEDAQKFKDKSVENIAKIIATISPDNYADYKTVKKVKALVKEGKFWEAASEVKLRTPEAGEQYLISYNSSTESLEPVYFWILDFLGEESKVDKLVDNFQSSPGSGHFSELMGKATRMQEEGMKIMQTIGVLIKSVINIIYDLRQFKMRFVDYDAAKSNDENKKQAGMLALKQVWMDNVDIKRGNSSIKAMTFSQQGAFVTLLSAFMKVNSLEEIDKEDLNDIVKRVLKQRMLEFLDWKKLSETELRKRYNIQKHWLRSQVDSLKLYSRWALPYLRAAEELRMGSETSAALVKAFNTILLKLTLLKKDELDVIQAVVDKQLPPGFDKMEEKKRIRKYLSCVLVDFTFRGIPQRVDQHYGFGGKSDVTFRSFALNTEEVEELKKRLEESDLKEALKLVQGATVDSLKEIEDDIRYFLEDKDVEENEDEKEEKDSGEDINPFSALFGLGGKKKEKKDKKDKDKEKIEIKSDSYAEALIRALAKKNAKSACFGVYDIYKKSHGMASVPFGDLFP